MGFICVIMEIPPGGGSAMKTILIASICAFLGCQSSCGVDIRTTTADAVKCVVKYPADTLTQAMQLARALAQASSPEQYAANLIAWAEGAKDSQFAMCVLTTIEDDILRKAMPGASQQALAAQLELPSCSALSHSGVCNPDNPVVEAIEQFRKRKFGNLKFEPPPAD